jgi:hypothetical protein
MSKCFFIFFLCLLLFWRWGRWSYLFFLFIILFLYFLMNIFINLFFLDKLLLLFILNILCFLNILYLHLIVLGFQLSWTRISINYLSLQCNFIFICPILLIMMLIFLCLYYRLRLLLNRLRNSWYLWRLNFWN